MSEFLHHEEHLGKEARKSSVEDIDLGENSQRVINRRFDRLFQKRSSTEENQYRKNLSSLTNSLLRSVENTFLSRFEAEILQDQIWTNHAFAHYLERERKAGRQEKRGDLDHILSSELGNMLILTYLSKLNAGREHMQRIRQIAENMGEKRVFGKFFTGIKGAVAFGRVIQEEGKRVLYVPDAHSDVFDKIDLVLTAGGARRADFRDWENVPIQDWPDRLKSQIYAVQMKCSTDTLEPNIKYLDCNEPRADVSDPEADLTGVDVHAAWKGINVSGFYVELPAREIDEEFNPSANIKRSINSALEQKEASYAAA